MRTFASRLKTALAVTGFFFVALNCDTRRKTSRPEAPPPASHTASAATAPPEVPPLPAGYRTEDEKNSIAVFRVAAQATVFVTERQVQVDYYGEASEVAAGSGTGFVWDTDGHIVTNFHVVKDAHSLAVTLFNHKSFEAKLVGVEPFKDIAVLAINAPKDLLSPIHLPDHIEPLEVGQKAIAIGNPFGLDETLTTGVISAIGREVLGVGGVSIRDMVQTDAAINPGNSGGPLLDSSGRLIGMNTMIYSRSGASAGIGFAVPVTSIARVVPQIIRTGHAEQLTFGVRADPAMRLERAARVQGVIVVRVVPGSPADKAGIRGVILDSSGITVRDIIVGIDEVRIDDYDSFYNTIDRHKPGDKVLVTILREGKIYKTTLELSVAPNR
jgi:S1-C subfamily serine protease